MIYDHRIRMKGHFMRKPDGFVQGLPVLPKDLKEMEAKVKADPVYGSEAEIIKKTLLKYPNNTDPEIVAMKICLIDFTNSTHLFESKKKVPLERLVEIIIHIKDFDKRLAAGDEDLVRIIALRAKRRFKGENTGINLFSFASKYCCYHNFYIYDRDDYSIYDGVLRDHLQNYYKSASPRWIDWLRTHCRYKRYNKVIEEILDENHIGVKNKRRLFDYLVWYPNRRQ